VNVFVPVLLSDPEYIQQQQQLTAEAVRDPLRYLLDGGLGGWGVEILIGLRVTCCWVTDDVFVPLKNTIDCDRKRNIETIVSRIEILLIFFLSGAKDLKQTIFGS
jgi:hypothetical protein